MQRLCRPLRLAPVAFETLMGFEAPALSGFGLFFLRIVCWGTWYAPSDRCIGDARLKGNYVP